MQHRYCLFLRVNHFSGQCMVLFIVEHDVRYAHLKGELDVSIPNFISVLGCKFTLTGPPLL
jgi:hypothetical protein